MIITRTLTTCVAAAAISLVASISNAGQMTSFAWFSGVASVAATSVVPPSAPNNENVVGTSPNEFFLTQKDYTGIGPVDLVFGVSDTGGTTEYHFIEGVANSTGLDWGSYHLELGFGTGALFTKSTSGDALDFDAPDSDSLIDFNPGAGIFPTVIATEDDIYASGGVLPNGGFAGYFHFHIDVPDGITEFTLRQSPVAVPEPATWMLAVAGVGALCLAGRRRLR
jgi:hypothetical protein